jgi:predicted O-methyltransferase YrrM
MLLLRGKRLRQGMALLETGSFLLVKLLIKNRPAARLYPGKAFRAYMSLVGRERWESIDIIDAYPQLEGERVVLEHLSDPSGTGAVAELAVLALICKASRPERIFEIGTFRGRTALNFALNTPERCRIHTLDLPPHEKRLARQKAGSADEDIISRSDPGVDYRGKDVAHKIEQLYGDSSDFDFSPYFDSMDIVFVDGAHHYDAALSDTTNALRMVRPGGVIIWHDFANYGDYNDVTRAILNRLPASDIIQFGDTQLAMYQRPER